MVPVTKIESSVRNPPAHRPAQARSTPVAVELSPPSEQIRPRRGSLLGVLLAGQFMVNVDGAVVNIAAPTIRTGLGTGAGPVALVVSGCLIACAVLLVTGARLGATNGRRRIFLWGLAGFTAASLACGIAPGVGWLIVARFPQGRPGRSWCRRS